MTDFTRFGFDPHLGWGVLITLLVITLVIWGVYAFRGGRAWLTRALAISLLTAALANPLLIRENREPLKSTIAVVMDRSASMSIDGRDDLSDDVLSALQAQMPGLSEFDLRMIETRKDAPQTDLTTTLLNALSGTPRSQIAGTIFVTDGQVHDIPTDLSVFEEYGPVHSLIIGREDEMDRRIEITSSPSYGIVGEKVVLKIKVDAELPIINVKVAANDSQPRYIPVQPGVETEVTVEIDRRGPNSIAVSIPDAPEELTTINNIAALTISGIRDTLRVLLITGEPHQGARAWRDLLKSDPMVDLVHFTILRPPHKRDATPNDELSLIAFPTMELFDEKLDEFDLIIFDRYRRRGVLHLRYLDNIARYVDKGGALLIAAGEPFAGPSSLHRTPLSSVLPLAPTGQIKTDPFRPKLSEMGEKHSVTKTLKPSEFGHWYRYIEAREVTGNVLMQTPEGKPLLALDRVGDGRVAELMSDQLWLWARGHDGGGPFAELIRRLVHWMMKEPELEEEFLSLNAGENNLTARLSSLTPDPKSLTVTDPTGRITTHDWQSQKDGVFTLSIPDPQFGLYRAQSGDKQAILLYGPSQPKEFIDLKSTTERLIPVGEKTDGSTRRVSKESETPQIRAASGSGDNWIGLRDRKAYTVTDSQTEPLLPAWLVAGILFALLLLAWRREGR